MIVVDTSFLYALADRRDARHQPAAVWYSAAQDELVTTPLILAEIDYLVAARRSRDALTSVRRDLVSGAMAIEWWPHATTESVEIAERYGDLGISLADASLVALATRVGTTTLATFDERHFRAVRPLAGAEAFTLVPTDAAPASG